jgi:hypothetical protein
MERAIGRGVRALFQYLYRLFGVTMKTENLARFGWLADAPLFIDAAQIDQFYDAVVRPTYIEGATSMTIGATGEVTVGGEVSGKGKLSFGGGLLNWITGATGEVEAGGKGTAATKDGTSESRQTQWIPIRTPQRQLGQLIRNYDSNPIAKARILEFGPTSDAGPLYDAAIAAKLPRAIVILDLPGCDEAKGDTTRLFPMAAELTNGNVALLYKQWQDFQFLRLRQEFEKTGIPGVLGILQELNRHLPKSDPGGEKKLSSGQLVQGSWEQFESRFDAWDTMKLLEDGVGAQRIRWIDFQMSCGLTKGRPNKIHLHICPAGEFDTGVFAFNFVYRGFYHGVRIVATLKSGTDLNVLAIYEK